MDYIAYTDGSCVKDAGRAASAFIIRTENMLVYNDVFVFPTIYVLDAELFAIRKVLEYMLEVVNVNKGDKITIKIDSMHAVKLCRDVFYNRKTDYEFLAKEMRVLINECRRRKVWIDFKKVHAHVGKMNMNTCVDRMAKSIVKNYEICMR